MDMVTLALAKKYTDEKVRSGGNSEELAKIKADGGVGYTEGSFVEFVPEASYEFSGGMFYYPIPNMPNAVTEIITKIDGVEFNSTSQTLRNPETGDTIFVAGNGAMIGLNPTGDPYLTAIAKEDGVCMVMVVILAEAESEETTQHTVSVSVFDGVRHTLDPKYIPRTVIDLTDVIYAYLHLPTTEQVKTLDKERCDAFIAGFMNENMTVVYNSVSDDGDEAYVTKFTPVAYSTAQYSETGYRGFSVYLAYSHRYSSGVYPYMAISLYFRADLDAPIVQVISN